MSDRSPEESRRKFLKQAGAALGSVKVVAQLAVSEPAKRNGDAKRWSDGVGLPTGWRQMKKFDAHNHLMQAVQKPDADWSTVESMQRFCLAVVGQILMCQVGTAGIVECLRRRLDKFLVRDNSPLKRLQCLCDFRKKLLTMLGSQVEESLEDLKR